MNRTLRYGISACVGLGACALGLLLAPPALASPRQVPPSIEMTGSEAGSRFGTTVAAVGDVNGDGYGDIVIGECPYRHPVWGPGRARLYLGGPSLDTIPDLTFEQGSFLSTGFVVAGVGDMNGDGYADIAMAAPMADPGRVFLYFGGSPMDAEPDLLLNHNDGLPQELGASVAPAGDLNGDGYDDVLVGDPGWRRDALAAPQGRAYVYFGGPIPDDVPDLVFDTPTLDPGFDPFWRGFGIDVSSAGDFNSDGFPDVAVLQGTDFATLQPALGRAFVYYGGAGMDDLPDIAFPSRSLQWSSDKPPQAPSATSVGDVNGDGVSDLAVTAARSDTTGGREAGIDSVDVYFGGQSGDEATRRDVVLRGGDDVASSHSSICGGADVNGDGYADVMVGVVLARPEGVGFGVTYCYFGGPSLDGDADAVLVGPPGSALSGWWIAAGDITGDGIAEVIVGAPGVPYDTTDPGHVFIYDLSPVLPARAFLRDGHRTVPLTRVPAEVCIRFEPIGEAYQNEAVDQSSLRLVSVGTGAVAEIMAVAGKPLVEGDTDRNGVAELTACFSRDGLQQLFSEVSGRQTVDATLEGRLVSGRRVQAPLSLTVIGLPARKQREASVWPNPLNPQATLTFPATRPGPVSVRLYDVRGRLLRTLLSNEQMPAGAHQVTIDGSDDRGRKLPSGIYFYRIEGPDGVTTGRFAIMK